MTVWLAAAIAAAGLAGAAVAGAEPDATTATPAPPPAPAVAAPPSANHVPTTGTPAAPGPGGSTPTGLIDHDGLFTVGVDIVPGVYTSPGPQPGDTCYWRRISADGTTLDNALTKQPQTVQIDATDKAFKTNGCQTWQLSPDAAPPNQQPPWLSQLELRHSLDILNGLAGQSGNGQLPSY